MITIRRINFWLALSFWRCDCFGSLWLWLSVALAGSEFAWLWVPLGLSSSCSVRSLAGSVALALTGNLTLVGSGFDSLVVSRSRSLAGFGSFWLWLWLALTLGLAGSISLAGLRLALALSCVVWTMAGFGSLSDWP